VRLLRAAGFTAKAFSSAPEFLARGGGDAYGCVILDVRMPGMDGLALQEKLSSLGSRMSVICITAYADDGAEERAMRNGAKAFLRKPFSEGTLLEAIRTALGSSAKEAEAC
jgi:FixJ family two-component response regulator